MTASQTPSADALQGYYRFPTVCGDRVVFVSEDDLWEVPTSGGVARRLTSGRGHATSPHFSPDGRYIAFTGHEEGTPEVYVMDAGGGPVRRLTFTGARSTVVGWTPDSHEIVFRSNYREAFSRAFALHAVAVDGGEPRRIDVGPAHDIAWQDGGPGRLLCRNADDLAWWKRYRGGTAGALWIDAEGSGQWRRLLPEITAGLVRPMWIGRRVWFLTDSDGYANLYSCTPDGSELRRHTDHRGFYARFAATDGDQIVYTVGGELWRYDCQADEAAPIAVAYASPRTHLSRKFVDAEDYLDDFELHPKGHSLAVTSRGKLFNFGNWEGAVRQTGAEQGVRYRAPLYLPDGERLVVVSDAAGEEGFEFHSVDGSAEPEPLELSDGFDPGRIIDVRLSPDGEGLAFSNHRYELVYVDLDSGEARVVDRSDYGRIAGFDISSDGRWLAYAVPTGHATGRIRIADLDGDACHDVTSGRYLDIEPVFDPQGRYLYFLSYRKFNPVYDQVFFELSFPRAMKPCVVTLRDDVESLFLQKPRPLSGDDDGGDDDDAAERPGAEGGDGEAEAGDGSAQGDGSAPEDGVQIDFDAIGRRIEVFPGSESDYGQLGATDERVFWTVFPIRGSLDQGGWSDDDDRGGTLRYFDVNTKKEKTFSADVSQFALSGDRRTIALWTHDGLRVVSAQSDGVSDSDDDDDEASRQTGWIDLGRVSVAVEPRAEWGQMLREAWRLMRDQFWTADMSGIDWQAVWQRYSPLLDRVGTRTEFSDLVWTMQGELGTSHAYEKGGDLPEPPPYYSGFLGAEFTWDAAVRAEVGGREVVGGYRISHLVRAETWDPAERSPLAAPGVDLAPGDALLAINGQRLTEHVSVQQRLVNRAGEEVEVVVARADQEGQTRVERKTVRALPSEFAARYREWVIDNRSRVHEATDGQVGYVHIPDMGPGGFAEFHRSYVSENERKALIVDVRYNGGGHVSQLILEKLARPRLGYDIQRWGKPVPYPAESVMGPLVALTDEHAGSDGDIFSHCFKLMELGPLLGKRTWGGVIGIWPRHALVDGSVTTQPEFSFWFTDVGFGLENWGTEPDVEVELVPESDTDAQLEAAIARAVELLEAEQPGLPDFGPRPNLAPPDELVPPDEGA